MGDDPDRLALGAAAQLVGLGQRMLDLTVDYVKQREQFGVPIGSFQAVKHHLADALKELAFARPAVRRAAATDGAPRRLDGEGAWRPTPPASAAGRPCSATAPSATPSSTTCTASSSAPGPSPAPTAMRPGTASASQP